MNELLGEEALIDVQLGQGMHMIELRVVNQCGYQDTVEIEVQVSGCEGQSDYDCNGSIDLGDHEAVAACVTGPGGEVSVTCDTYDRDCDGDVDLQDWSLMQADFGP